MQKMLTLGILLVSLVIPASVASRAIAADPEFSALLLTTKAFLIKEGAEPDELESDYHLIVGTSDQITKEGAKQGLPVRDIASAAAAAWLRLRFPDAQGASIEMRRNIELFQKVDKDHRQSIFLQTYSGMGKLTVNSTPSGALIRVGGIPWDDPTNTSRFVDEGKQQITLTKDGYRTHRASVDVKKRASVIHTANLEKE